MRPLARNTSRFALIAAATLVASALPAQKLDRSAQPTPAKSPAVRVPTWTRTTLSNGAQLVVTEKHDLPLIALNINFVGGSANFEAPEKLGVGSLTAAMLSEGTTSKSAEQLSDAQQMLG